MQKKTPKELGENDVPFAPLPYFPHYFLFPLLTVPLSEAHAFNCCCTELPST
jgi:hypothetical protein